MVNVIKGPKILSYVLNKFPGKTENPFVERGEGIFIYTEDGRKILDATAGWCSQMVLGYDQPEVLKAMNSQMKKFCHMDHNIWRHREMEELASLILSRAPRGLNKVYFSGNSGSESVEAAIKISYQAHYDRGKKDKVYIISRDQSYHGSTLQSLAVSERDNLEFYKPMFPGNRARIPQHHPLHMMKPRESLDEYARRSANDLENKIIELGPSKVASFVGETVMGQLQGDVPPAPAYWSYIRKICDQYDVHLILDEVYCGLGRSGKVYCCEWDNVVPDFVCFGKTLGAGYAPLSVVVTNEGIEDVIRRGQGRIQHGHTHQGYSLGVAASLAVQKIVQKDETLEHVNAMGEFLKTSLKNELHEHPYFREVRGRGLMVSLEYNCSDNPKFGADIFETLRDRYNILVSSKWHRISLSPPFIITQFQVEEVVQAVIEVFKQKAKNYSIAQ